MEIHIMSQEELGGEEVSGITLQVALGRDDIEQLKSQAARALEIERMLPDSARSPLADMSEEGYVAKFIETRAIYDALELRGIVPIATPRVKSPGYVEGQPFACAINVQPRLEIGLTSMDPLDLATSRIPLPGFSAQAAREGAEDVEFVDDDKALRIALVKRLDSELPDDAIRALAAEYRYNFELDLAQRNIDPESYRLAHGLNEEQYDLMMARNALADAHWNLALDAVFAEVGLGIADDDLLTTFELQAPGHAEELLELHELRNDLWKTIEKLRRGKALKWLKENALK